MNAFLQTLRNLGPMRLAAIALVTFSLLGFFIFITTRIAVSPLEMMYADLDQQDSSAIIQKLDGLKVPYQVDSSGGTIRVPSDQVGRLRMMMAGDGLPKGGSIGYEIFDQKEGFGTTSFVQNINHLRALEGELARTIGSINPIQTARVHLVLPQRELFSHNTQTATASVFLKTRNGAVLSREQISAIQHLISTAVPQLQPGAISIIDDRGNLLARPKADGAAGAGDTGDDMRAEYEQAQARKIEDLLSQTLGFGKARAQVSADIDFDRITTSSEIYDPDSQVVRSSQSTNEEATTAEGSSGGGSGVSVTNNLPSNPSQIASGGEKSTSSNKNNRTEETMNYEINKTVRSQVREGGQVRRLSVAVVVDGNYKTDTDEKTKVTTSTYVPRSEEEMKKIRDLVASAVNLDTARGDTIQVENMQFAQGDTSKDAGSGSDLLMGIPKSDLLHSLSTVLLAAIGLLAVLLIVRPILRKLLEGPGSMVGGGDSQSLLGGSSYGGGGGYSGTAQLPAPGGGGGDMMETSATESEIERMIDISKVEGRVKASSLRKIGEIIDKHPDEAVGILRNWMYQENR